MVVLPQRNFIKHCGYYFMIDSSILSYTELWFSVTELQLPMRVSLELDVCSITYRHVIGISPYMSSKTSQIITSLMGLILK